MVHRHPTILVVDDNDDLRDGFSQLFRAEGYIVETARDGRDALLKLRYVHPCVILLDLMMPDMSGYDFRKAQIADPDLKDIPVIVHSAVWDVHVAAKQIGAIAYMEKPVVFDRLMALIRQHCLK